MNLELEGRVAMVAAGSKGLGFATAQSLVKEGCSVSICARGREALDAARERLKQHTAGAKVWCRLATSPTPLSSPRGTSRREGAGEVDILVTNTPEARRGPLHRRLDEDSGAPAIS